MTHIKQYLYWLGRYPASETELSANLLHKTLAECADVGMFSSMILDGLAVILASGSKHS